MGKIIFDKAKRVEIQELLKQGLSYSEVSERTGAKLQYLYNVANKLKLKKRLKRQEAKKFQDIKQLSESQKDHLLKINRNERLRLQDRIEELETKNKNLEHQIIGFRSVISYLENMSGLKASQ